MAQAKESKQATEQQTANQPEAQRQATLSNPQAEAPEGWMWTQDSNGEQVLARVGMDGENPASVNNPELKAVRGGQPERDESSSPSSEAEPQYPLSERAAVAERETKDDASK